MVGETVLPLFWRNFITVFLTLGIWSYLYKMHPLYGFIEHVTLGFMTAHGLLVALDTVNRGIVIPVSTNFSANFLLIVPLIIGLLSYTYFTPQYIGIYRVVNGFLIAITLGIGLGRGWQTTWNGISNQMRFSITNLNYLVTIGVTVMGSMYFVNLRRFETPTKYPRWVATILAATTIGWMCGTLYIQRIAVVIGWWLTVLMPAPGIPIISGLIVVALFAIAIAIDALFSWRKILGLSKPRDVRVSVQ